MGTLGGVIRAVQIRLAIPGCCNNHHSSIRAHLHNVPDALSKLCGTVWAPSLHLQENDVTRPHLAHRRRYRPGPVVHTAGWQLRKKVSIRLVREPAAADTARARLYTPLAGNSEKKYPSALFASPPP